MVGSGKPVKSNATNSAPVKTASKKRRVSSAAIVSDGESVPVVEDAGTSAPPEAPVGDVTVPPVEGEVEGAKQPKEKTEKVALDVATLLEKLKEEITAHIASVKTIAALLRETTKAHGKELRAKGSRKRKNAEIDASAVVEPKPEKTFEIQEPLREFLGTQPGEKVGKRAARKTLSIYIKNNNLQDPDDHTLIKPDEKLLKLFGPPLYVTTKKNLGYSNLNALRYIQKYFITPEEPVSEHEETENENEAISPIAV